MSEEKTRQRHFGWTLKEGDKAQLDVVALAQAGMKIEIEVRQFKGRSVLILFHAPDSVRVTLKKRDLKIPVGG